MKYIDKKSIKTILAAVFTLAILAVGALWYFHHGNVKGVQAGWWDDSWSYRKAIVINHSYVTGDLENFPVLISLTDTSLGSHAQVDGDDIIFISDNGQKFSHEIEAFATSTGVLVAWVKVPQLSSTVDTPIYMYYGNAGAGNQEDVANVWDENYKGVWHLRDSSTASTSESTGRAVPLQVMTGNESTGTGKDDGAMLVNANGEGMYYDGDYHINSQGSIGFWYKETVNCTTYNNFFSDNDDGYQFSLMRNADGGAGDQHLIFYVNGDAAYFDTAPNVFNGGWHYINVTWDDAANQRKIFVDGSQQDSDTSSFSLGTQGEILLIGQGDDWWWTPIDGYLDEFRISSEARSNEWFAAEYANQNDPSHFFSIQSEETGPGPVGYWSFDEGRGQTAHDESGQGNDGSLGESAASGPQDPQWQDASQCVSGNCLWFDGADNVVTLGTPASLGNLDEKTITAWFRFNGSGGGGYGRIIQKEDEAIGGWGLYLDGNNHDLIYFHVFDSTVGIWHTPVNSVTATSTWYFVALTYDRTDAGNDPVIYLNGVAQSVVRQQAPEGSAKDDLAQPAYIGNRYNSGNYDRAFDGNLDEVKIYPYSRTADQIRQDYAAGLAGIKSNSGVTASFGSRSDSWMSDGLVGYWKFDEPVGSYDDDNGYEDAIDSSGNGRTGDANGNADVSDGKFGNGAAFDGTTDYLSYATNDFGNIFTISVWAKPGNVSNIETIIANTVGGGSNDGFKLYINHYLTNNRAIEFETGNGGDVSTSLTEDGTIGFSQWNHIVVVVNEILGKAAIYVNGIDQTKDSDILTDFKTSGTWRIGSFMDNQYSFNGKIDEVRIYNRALSADEVKKLYDWAPGPVAWWKFDEKSGTTAYDSIASTTYSGGNHGTLGTTTASQPAWTQGEYGGALRFDGSDDFIELPAKDDLNIAGAITISAWVKTTSAIAGIFGGHYYTDPFNGYSIFIGGGGVSDGKITFWSSAYGSWVASDSTVNDGNWHHVAVAVSGSSATFYRDGVSNGTKTSAQPDSYSGIRAIGARSDGAYPLDGLIDDVKIYNYARTQKQILEDMSARGGSASGGGALNFPVLHLTFDEGYGDTAFDSSIFGNNGTLNAGGSGDNDTTAKMWDLNGKFGRAMEFDGVNDRVVVAHDTAFDITSDITLSAWVKRDTINGTYDSIIGKHNNSVWDYNLFICGTGSSCYPAHDDQLVFESDATDKLYSTEAITDNDWHLASFTRSGDEYTFYIDGVPAGGGTNGTAFDADSYSIYIGTDVTTVTDTYFDGLMDEIYVYNYALSEDEIKKLYNGGMAAVMGAPSTPSASSGQAATSSFSKSIEYCVPGSLDYCAPPVGEWKFDKKSGTTTYDTSGNGNDGYFVSADTSPVHRGANYCHAGACLQFDGSDDTVYTADSSLLHMNNSGSITFSAWINTGGYLYSSDGQDIIRYDDDDSGDGDSPNDRNLYLLRIYHPSDKIEFTYGPSSGLSSINSNATISSNRWYHVEVTRDTGNDTENIYINGILDNSETDTTTGSWETTGQYMKIGAFWDGGSDYEFFHGLIDDVRVYNYARTPAQIAWDYNRGAPIA